MYKKFSRKTRIWEIKA